MIQLKKAHVSINGEGHVMIVVREGEELELADVVQIDQAKRKLCGDKKHTVLFVTPAVANITASARDFAASIECNYNAIAKAIVTASMSTRLISNFFISFHRPVAPTKVFNSIESATEWLERARSGQQAII